VLDALLRCAPAASAACQILRTDRESDDAAPDDYVGRVNLAIDHIVKNLAGPLRLEDVSRAAYFSPFHFHRIFKSIVGETLHQFVKRQRLERALFLMSHAPGRALTDVALDCGFSSSSDFSRSFKQRYGVPPSAFDLETFRRTRRDEFERVLSSAEDGPRLRRLPVGANPDGFEVTLRDLPRRTVAYVRVLNPYRESAAEDACRRLMAWATERGLEGGQWLGYMWEDPEIVALEDCRYDVAVVVDDVEPDGTIGRFEFPPMRVAEVCIRGDIELEQRAIDWLYKTWLPSSGFVPDDQPAFEAWAGLPFAHGIEHFELACQLPVKPA